jgi:hypothetical protein
MICRHIPDIDSLFRCCIHPHSFKNRKLLVSKKLLNLKYDEKTRTLHGSLTWERYVPTTKYVHAYGCRLASHRNKNSPSGSQCIYCGAYRLNGSTIRALPTADGLNEISSADVVHNIENREIAHADLRISFKPGYLDDEGTKTAIVDRLWNACCGPLTYIAVCDQHINPHPSLYLSTPPAGQYSDTRSYLYRLWCIIRFQISRWIWRKFCQNATKSLAA